ncbi:MAG: hypothetical protein BIFFINMI_02151 [Phycisphaerae bacterium]|nr:hypothetical protein [Phycisphaerae bacterium]
MTNNSVDLGAVGVRILPPHRLNTSPNRSLPVSSALPPLEYGTWERASNVGNEVEAGSGLTCRIARTAARTILAFPHEANPSFLYGAEHSDQLFIRATPCPTGSFVHCRPFRIVGRNRPQAQTVDTLCPSNILIVSRPRSQVDQGDGLQIRNSESETHSQSTPCEDRPGRLGLLLGALAAQVAPAAPDLAGLLAAWLALPDHVKATIQTLVRATVTGNGGPAGDPMALSAPTAGEAKSESQSY